MPVLIKPDFLSLDSCDELIRGFQRLGSAPPRCSECSGSLRQQPNRTEIAAGLFKRGRMNDVLKRLSDIRAAALDEVEAFFDATALAVEFTLLTEMRAGDAHPRHADNERQSDNGQWVPNHTPWRAYAAMVYLNTSGADYEGGVLRFPARGEEVFPRAGELVCFPCGHEYEHEVTPIQSGCRYSISIWLTQDRGRAERWA